MPTEQSRGEIDSSDYILFASPDTRVRHTSYTQGTAEVREMLRATSEGWPGVWYEFLQGALDYNNPSRGKPSFLIYFEGSRSPITLAEFTARPESNPQIERIEVRNYIKDDRGLKPSYIALTEHVDGWGATLGQHGRGLSIASTAVACGLAEEIGYISRTPELGAWVGKGSMYRDVDDPSASPCFSLTYKLTDRQTEETIIGINKPCAALVRALHQIPQDFLPARSGYRFNRLDSGAQTSPNLLTVFTTPTLIFQGTDRAFGERELYSIGIEENAIASQGEPARVEILAKAGKSEEINHVYTDGLKVRLDDPKIKCAFEWSFWGFREARNGYNPSRSNDSRRMEGYPMSLVASTLRKSTPEILAKVIISSTTENPCWESKISRYDLTDLTEGEKLLFSEAWEQAKSRLDIAHESLITTDIDLAKKEPEITLEGEKEPRRVIAINSKGFAEALLASIPGIKSLEQALKDEAESAKQKLEEQRAQEAEKIQQAKRETLISQGRATFAENTQETIKLAAPDNPEIALELSRQHLLHELAENRGRIVWDDNKGTFYLEMDAGSLDKLPSNATNDLGELVNFYKTFLAILSNNVALEIRVEKGKKGAYFLFNRDDRTDRWGNVTLGVSRGELIATGKDHLQLRFTNNESEMFQLYQTFYTKLLSDLRYILGPDLAANYEIYSQSRLAQEFPPFEKRLRVKMERERVQKEQEALIKRENKLFDLLNERRKLLELPPLTRPRELAVVKPDTVASYVVLPSENKELPTQQPVPFYGGHGYQYTPFLRLISPFGSMCISGGRRRIDLGNSPEGIVNEQKPRHVDFELRSGRHDRTRGYLTSHFNPKFSETLARDDFQAVNLEEGEKRELVCLRYEKEIREGYYALYTPPGFVPVAFSRADKVEFFALKEKNLFAFEAGKVIPPGFSIYYKRNSRTDRTTPGQKEKTSFVEIERLNPEWQELLKSVSSMQASRNLTDKQTADILIRAWTRVFTYSDDAADLDRYGYLHDSALAEKVINEGLGSCGHAGLGFLGLARSANIPARDVISWASHDGRFSETGNGHSLTQLYIGGRWVLVEPQGGYIEDDYKVEKLPQAFSEELESLIGQLPRGQKPKVTGRYYAPSVNEPELPNRSLITTKDVRNVLVAAATVSGSTVLVPMAIQWLSEATSSPTEGYRIEDLVNRTPEFQEEAPQVAAQTLAILTDLIHQYPTQVGILTVVGTLAGSVVAAFKYGKRKQRQGRREGRLEALKELREIDNRIHKKAEEKLT